LRRNKRNIVAYLWYNHKPRIVLALLIILSMLLILADKKSPIVYIRGAVQQYAAVFQYSAFRIKRLFNSEKANRRLSLKLTELAVLNQQYAFFSEENKKLRKLLKLKEHLPFGIMAGDIYAIDMTGVPGYASLNIGSESGCAKDMALIVPEGVIGRIIEVGSDWSRAQLLTNPEARISARVLRTGDRGIVRWVYGDVFKMDGVLYRSGVEVGDVVVTSGVSSVFPGGLLIGKVFKVTQEQGAMFKDVFLHSSVNFQTLGLVFVVRNEEKKAR